MQRLRNAVTFSVVSLVTLVTTATLSTLAVASTTGLRNVFLNGIDISSAKSQDLKHVDVHISETGDIFLVAPHYQVNEEDSFIPLSRYVQGLNQPVHQQAQKMNGALPSKAGPAMPPPLPMTDAAAAPVGDVATSGAQIQAPNGGLEPKAGEPVAASAGDTTAPPQLPAAADAAAAAAADKAAPSQTPTSAK